MVVNAPLHCPPRHTAQRSLPLVFDMQVISISSVQDPINFESPAGDMTHPCEDVQSDEYFADARRRVLDESSAHFLKPWDQHHAVAICGRTKCGQSVHLRVRYPLSVAVEFPESHGTFQDVWSYFLAMETDKKLRFGMGYFCNPQLKKRYRMRARSNNWVPDAKDKTKPKQWPVVVVSFKNKSDANKAIRYMQTTEVFARGNARVKVAVFETTSYVKAEQRFVVETGVTPAGWITVSNAVPLAWTCSTCDYDMCCLPGQVQPQKEDQSVCPLTIISWDIEVRNGTAEDRVRMKKLGLDKFPKAHEPSNQVIQISVIVRTADGRTLPFLLELDDDGEHLGKEAFLKRTFGGTEYRVLYFQAEPDMICFFRDMVCYYDADIVLSFNGDKFDFPYIIGRMGDRPPDGPHGRFYQLGRLVHDYWDTKYVMYTTKDVGHGRRKDVPVLNTDDEDLPKKRFPLAQLALENGVDMTPDLFGRISLDLCALIRDLSKADKYLAFKNYTLDNMAARFLGDHKVNFTHNDIFDAWHGQMSGQRLLKILSNNPDADDLSYLMQPCANEEEVDRWLVALSGTTLAAIRAEAGAKQRDFDRENASRLVQGLRPMIDPEPVGGVTRLAQRRLLGDYCMKDSELPIRILDKLGSIMFIWQVSRVALTPPNAIINQGQMQRVSAMFIEEAWSQGRYVNRVMNRAMPYQGATVLRPKRGYYGGGDGKALVASGNCPPDGSFELPPIPVAKAARPPLEEMRPMFQRLAAEAGHPDALVEAALSAYSELPDGYDFSGMQLREVWQTVVQDAVLTLDFKSLYPSIMLSHMFCPANLLQEDEPLNAAEESAKRFGEKRKKAAEPKPARPEIFGSPKPELTREQLEQSVLAQQSALEMFEGLVNDEVGVESAATAAAIHDTRCELRRLRAELAKLDAAPSPPHEPDSDASDAEEADAELLLEYPSGIVYDLEDSDDYTTVCIVVTDSKGVFVKRRYHKFTKHDKGILPAMLERLLDGRAVYKKKMGLEKAVQGSLKLAFEAHADAAVAPADAPRIEEALEALRAVIKPVVKDKRRRAEVTAGWIAERMWVVGARGQLLALVDDGVNIFDGRQKALKVMANSIYGVTGAKQHSPVACCMIAESVTAVGRQMIEATKKCVLTQFAHFSPDVIYGDTDSVFVLVKEGDDVKAWAMASEIAEYCTRVIFAGTVNVLEDECIKRKMALFKKKTYVGMEQEDVKTGIYERGEKGIASVRRDKPEVLNILVRLLNKAFTELGNFSVETISKIMLRMCCRHFERLVQNTFPVEDYVIVCRINKMSESAHVNLARKLEQRTGTPVMKGDSVSYVHIKDPSEPKATRRVETPVVVKADDAVAIDAPYYLSNKIKNIIESTLSLFVPPEVIGTLFEVYQTILDQPGMRTLDQTFGAQQQLDPAVQRASRVEKALDRAIRAGRLPRGNVFPEPLRTAKRRGKETPAEKAAKRAKNAAAFKAFFKAAPPAAPEPAQASIDAEASPPKKSAFGMFGF